MVDTSSHTSLSPPATVSLPHPPHTSRTDSLHRVRCFGVVGCREQYINLLSADYSEMDALNALGLRRYCCRRMLLAHVDLIEKLLNYNSQTHTHVHTHILVACCLPQQDQGYESHIYSAVSALIPRALSMHCVVCRHGEENQHLTLSAYLSSMLVYY